MQIPVLNGQIQEAVGELQANSQVQAALEFLQNDHEATIKQQMEIAAIPAPTFMEGKRGEAYRGMLERAGLENVVCDQVGNIYGHWPGKSSGPTLAVFAHLDTVFPLDTPVVPEVRDGRIYGPGIADDSRGLVTVLTILRALRDAEIRTAGSIIFGATVCEEGLGDLKGVKAFCAEHPNISGFIALEPGRPGLITYECTGSKRYKVGYQGPGGHSFNDFGKPSATHALGRAIAKLADLEVPQEPKTTFTVGVVQGGSSVNSLAAEAEMLVDLRSTSAASLEKLEEQLLQIVESSAAAENQRWNNGEIVVCPQLVGNRPAGSQEKDAAIVQVAASSAQALGFIPTTQGPKGTDANVPLSLGIPSITLGCGGDFANVHSLGEWFDPHEAYFGPQQILLTILGLVGLQDVSAPLLKERKVV